MAFEFFSHNGEVLPIGQAVVPLGRVEYAYGFGVYETIRATKDVIYFLEEHCQRLIQSAQIIGLEHSFSPEFVQKAVAELVHANQAEACNLKILLVGAPTAEDATLDIICLNPLFPDRRLYRDGAVAITYKYERQYPQAKTLNMLSSYLAFRQAKAAGAYDALLIDRDGNVTEGTRTNFFGLKGRTLVSPPSQLILPGITRQKVLQVAQQKGFDMVEQPIPLDQIEQFDGCFLTSTSSKIMPLRQIDETRLAIDSADLSELIFTFNAFLASMSS